MGWNIFWTSAICLFIKYVLRIPLRYSEDALLIGDQEVHGEMPYAFFHDGRYEYDSKYGQSSGGVIHGTDPEAGRSESSDDPSDKIQKQE